MSLFSRLFEQKLDEYCKSGQFGGFTEAAYTQAKIEACLALMEIDFDPNETHDENYTILIEIASLCRLDLVIFLVESGADVNAISNDSAFALSEAATVGCKEVFDYLAPLTFQHLRKIAEKELQKGKFFGYRKNDSTLEEFVSAAFEGNINAVKKIISQGIDVNTISSNGEAALHKAIRANNLSIVRILLKAGANPSLKEEEQEYSPLMIAFNGSNVDWAIFQALLEAGADINSRASRGETALMLAVFKLNLKAVEKLLELGADVNDRDISGNTALAIAQEMRKRNDEVKQEFITEERAIVKAISVEDAELIEIIDLLKSYGAAE